MRYYVVNQRLKKDATGALVPVFPLDALRRLAGDHEIVTLYEGDEPVRPLPEMLATLRARMDGFDDGDALVLCGDPLLMAVATVTAEMHTGGDYLLYVWRKETGCYAEIDMSTYGAVADGQMPSCRYVTQ